MRELTLTTTPVTIKVNEKEYECKMSDVQVMAIAYRMQLKYQALLLHDVPNVEDVIAVAEETVEYIDKILGRGATAEIANGNPVSANDSMRWLTAIASAVAAAYGDALVEKYA